MQKKADNRVHMAKWRRTRNKVDCRVRESRFHRQAVGHTSCSRSAPDATLCPLLLHISAKHVDTQATFFHAHIQSFFTDREFSYVDPQSLS